MRIRNVPVASEGYSPNVGHDQRTFGNEIAFVNVVLGNSVGYAYRVQYIRLGREDQNGGYSQRGIAGLHRKTSAMIART